MSRTARIPLWALAAGVVTIIAGVLVLLAMVGKNTLPERQGPPIEDLRVERTVLSPGEIELHLRNAGPDPVTVQQVIVNDAYVGFEGGGTPIGRLESGTVSLAYPWIEGSPYAIDLMTSTGLVIPAGIAAAVETPKTNGDFLLSMFIIGLYIGVIPVTLGMIVLPVLRRGGPSWITALIAFTVGLLGFLAIDGTFDALELSASGGGVFGGAALVFLSAALAFLLLSGIDLWIENRRRSAAAGGASPWQLALMVAIGIGLHNLGEGLAIGSAYAIGELALGAFLIVGFAIHNTTEGLAIVAPLAEEKVRPLRMLGLGLIAGGPAILGALIGGSVGSPEIAAALVGIGVGAIAQVVVQLLPAMRDRAGKLLTPVTSAAMAGGALALYLTGLLVAV